MCEFRYKQVIVFRSDLKPSRGKTAAQAGHAAVSAAEEARKHRKEWFDGWFREGQCKIAVKVPNEKSLSEMEIYAKGSEGIGGNIRQSPEDFVVEEILADGSKAEVETEGSAKENVLGATLRRDRYLLCILVKRNWDTFIALGNIARELGINPVQDEMTGIKDAKAVTAQYITIENASMEDAQNFQLKDMEIRPLGYVRT